MVATGRARIRLEIVPWGDRERRRPVAEDVGQQVLAALFTSYWLQKQGRLPSRKGNPPEDKGDEALAQLLAREWKNWRVLHRMLVEGDFEPA